MRILYIHPIDSGNAGDKVILAGCRSLLDEAFGFHESIYCSIEKGEKDDSYLEEFEKEHFDLLVVSGTPWIWDMCEKSKKYGVLSRMVLMAEAKKAKMIALGIGSCFPLATNTLLNHFTGNHKEETRESLKALYSKFNLVITRDQIAQICMNTIETESFLAPCPACFMDYPESNKTGMPALVFYNPGKGLSADSFDDFFLRSFIECQVQFINRMHPFVLTMSVADHRWLIQNGFRTTLINGPIQLISALKSVPFVLSGRVHAAIPARMMGISTVILPVDTRYLTAAYVGAMPFFPYGTTDVMFTTETTRIDFSKQRQVIVSKLKEAIA